MKKYYFCAVLLATILFQNVSFGEELLTEFKTLHFSSLFNLAENPDTPNKTVNNPLQPVYHPVRSDRCGFFQLNMINPINHVKVAKSNGNALFGFGILNVKVLPYGIDSLSLNVASGNGLYNPPNRPFDKVNISHTQFSVTYKTIFLAGGDSEIKDIKSIVDVGLIAGIGAGYEFNKITEEDATFYNISNSNSLSGPCGMLSIGAVCLSRSFMGTMEIVFPVGSNYVNSQIVIGLIFLF
ncbi:MAG: hypothetical protein ABIH42_08970 [Planctomycetota bacterium]